MTDALRIDLALARAAGLPTRSANDASVPRDGDAMTATDSTDAMFSPLALLLTRFLPPQGTPVPTPTPEEAHLLLAYLQQRVVAVLHAGGIATPASMRVSVDGKGALNLTPAPANSGHVASLLRHDPDVARLVDVLRRPSSAIPVGETFRYADGVAAQAPEGPRSDAALRRALPWPWLGNPSPDDGAHGTSGIATPLVEAALGVGFIAVVLLVVWLLS